MKDYKDTLNLPTTEFAMKANLPQREPEVLAYWQEIHLYKKLNEQGKTREKFILHDGPPYANGHIHIGHALDKILKDIVGKSKTLAGKHAPFVPGWDCHGLPIELNVEKKIGKAGTDVSIEEFRKACREYANSQVNIQREEFKRLGVIGDWDHPYLTMDPIYEANIIRALAKIYENGHIYRGFKPVHWCVDCQSALAEAEVEYINKRSPAIDVRFQVVNENVFVKNLNLKDPGAGPISIPIWTTTPWTLPANEAVALHADSEYVLIQIETTRGTERLLLAASLYEGSLKRYQINPGSTPRVLGRWKGDKFKGILLRHPFYDKTVPIVLGEHVTMDAGTGAVHIAPSHGQEDYLVGQQSHLPMEPLVGNNGCFLPKTLLFAGEHVFKANDHVISILEQHNNLLAKNILEHSYPHCWRHKTPLIFLATPQWFIALYNQNQEQAHNVLFYATEHAANNIEWIPDWGKSGIQRMIATRPDWCISRQRTWGVPITLFVHKQTNEPHPRSVELMEKIAQQVEQKGLDIWFNSTPEDWKIDDAENYLKVNDVLDVWFDAGVSNFCVLENPQQFPELKYPADIYLEGTDQYRGWFQSSLLTAVARKIKATDAKVRADADLAPYKTALAHGFTVDDKGRKMSKSLGNVIAPDKVISSLGADILRLWVASTDYRAEIAISDDILKRVGEAYRRIRNTARYFLSNLFDFDTAKNLVPPEQMLSLDRWAVERTQLLQKEIIKAYEEYQFHLIYHKLHNFCIIEMGGFYLDIIKDRQYTLPKNSLARRSAQTAMYCIVQAMVRWMAPILSFTAEEIWKYLPGKQSPSVFLETWYKLVVEQKNDLLVQFDRQKFWQTMIQVREAVNKEIEKSRDEGEIGSSLEAEVELYSKAGSPLTQKLQVLGDELRFVLITSSATLHTTHEPNDAACNNIDNEELWVRVKPSTNPKCGRCWHRRADVGSDPEHPDICTRCVENISSNGEKRNFA